MIGLRFKYEIYASKNTVRNPLVVQRLGLSAFIAENFKLHKIAKKKKKKFCSFHVIIIVSHDIVSILYLILIIYCYNIVSFQNKHCYFLTRISTY